MQKNGGIGLIWYLMGLLIGLPSLLAVFLLLSRSGSMRKAAVFFMVGSFVVGAGWAAVLGHGECLAPAGVAALGLPLVLGANLAVVAGVSYLSGAWKSRLNAGLLVTQAILYGWLGFHGGAASQQTGFLLDRLALLMLVLINGTGALTLVFSLKYLDIHDGRRNVIKKRGPQFLAAAGFMLAAMNGLVLANHLLWLLFCWQIIVLTGFILISHDRSKMALNNGRSFVSQQFLGGIGFLAGAIWLQSTAQTLTISELLLFGDATLIMAPIACLVLAGLVAAAQFPFQAGLLRATTAPLPVSVLLQTATLVNAGLYLIIRLAPLFMNTWLAKIVVVIGAFSFAAAALLALMQHDAKRIFAFSTVSCAGLVIALAGLANLQAIYAAILLTMLHGATKALLFFSIGGNANSRISLRLVLLAAVAMVLPSFGIPLTQWTALEAAVQNPAALLLLIAGIVFSLLYWSRFISKRLAAAVQDGGSSRPEPLYAIPQLVLAVVVALSGLFSVQFINLFITPVLKENYRRFGDIAQGDPTGFLIRDLAGINPLLVFIAIAVIVGPGWLLLRWLCNRQSAKPVAKQTVEVVEAAEAVEVVEVVEAVEAVEVVEVVEVVELDLVECEAVATEEIAETIEPDDRSPVVGVPGGVMHYPIQSLLALFPDAPKTHLYATVIAGALIILMFEVVIR